MIAVRGLSGARVAVLGLGRSGLSAAQALRAGGAEVLCWDDGAAVREAAAAQGHALSDLYHTDWSGIARLILSPGIPHLYPAPHPVVAAAMAARVTVDNDIGLFFQSLATSEWDMMDTPPRVVAVTGSNGKSTTSALLHHILTQAGRPSQLAGNIGRGVLDIDPPVEGEIIVVELSSYQSELARALTPDIAIFTNLSPDHLDRHGGIGGYFAAKRRLFIEGGPDRAIIGTDEVEGQFLAGQLAETMVDDRVIHVSTTRKPIGPGWQVSARKGFLSEWRKGRQMCAIDLRNLPSLPGAHNYQNACAAFGAARALGLPPKAIEAGLRSYGGLAHRCQLIAEHGGVRYVNDSKATNVDSAMRALQAFDNVLWICGGAQKEGGLALLNTVADRIRQAYVIGQDAAGFASQLSVPTQVCTYMEAAVVAAIKNAREGDVVLLAPAAASFDQYDNFEMRGDDFTNHVRDILAL